MLRTESMDASTPLEHAQALVYVEGPKKVTDAALYASGALTDLTVYLHRSLVAVQNGEALGDRESHFQGLSGEAHQKYLNFLYAASDVLGEDVIQP